MKKSFILFLLLFLTTSCSGLNCTSLESLLGTDKNLISFSYSIAEELVETAHPPIIPMNPKQPIIITSFVDNNNLKETSRFGRTLQEHISSRLVQLGYTVREIKLRKDIYIKPREGETALSRHLENIRNNFTAQALLVGTYSISGRIMYINAKLVRPKDSMIIASKDYRLCMDDNILAMFNLKRTSGKCEDCIQEPAQPLLNNVLYRPLF